MNLGGKTMNCALIQGGVVVAILDLSEEQIQIAARENQAVIDISDLNPVPLVGWAFDGTKIIVPAGYGATRKITKLGFRQRLTFTELINITGAAMSTDPSVALPLQVLLSNLQVATYIDLNRADTQGGLGLLISLGLMSSDRVAAVLAAPITESERYKGGE